MFSQSAILLRLTRYVWHGIGYKSLNYARIVGL